MNSRRCRRGAGRRPALAAGVTVWVAVLTAVWMAGCTTTGVPQMAAFSTDGCSRFPDRSLIGPGDWCDCCLAHDLAYWRGGTEQERQAADEALRRCVADKTHNLTLANLMHAGVRAGGGPYLFTAYRWGYGWPYGRGYTPISPAEDEQVRFLRNEYLARNGALSCKAEGL